MKQWTLPAPASSKTDSVPDMAEPTSNAGSSSVITYLQKGKKKGVVRGGITKSVRKTIMQTARLVKKEGEEMVLQPMEKTMVRSAVLLRRKELMLSLLREAVIN